MYPLIILSFLQVVLKLYDEVKTEDQSKQQELLDKNKARLMTYDKSFWEIKPTAKVTGKKQPSLRESMSVCSYIISYNYVVMIFEERTVIE